MIFSKSCSIISRPPSCIVKTSHIFILVLQNKQSPKRDGLPLPPPLPLLLPTAINKQPLGCLPLTDVCLILLPVKANGAFWNPGSSISNPLLLYLLHVHIHLSSA